MPFIAYFAQTFFLGIVKIFYYKHKLQNWFSADNAKHQTLGFVPTMGALHDGHMSLVEAANKHCDLTIASIFVNPKQFDKPEDLLKYPRTEEQDCDILVRNGCNIAFIPNNDDLYGGNYKNIELDLGHLAHVYEGEKREGHFEGVIQVLYQLFDAIKPTDVFFGQKDYQQCMVVNKILDRYFPSIIMHTIPTHRDKEGLALSSRNKRLSEEGIVKARHFNKALHLAAKNMHEGTEKALKMASEYMLLHGLEVEYLDFANANDLTPSKNWEGIPQKIVAVSAVWLEGVRLIDNFVF